MPTVAVNARPSGGYETRAAGIAVVPGRPVTVMLHGFRYAPDRPGTCPHVTLYGELRDSWPRRLGLTQDRPGIGFGWQGSGTIWSAYAAAGRAGLALAELVRDLRAAGSGPVHLIAHSLGARVALSALPALAPGDIGRMVLMTAAEFRRPAAQALASPAGRAAELLNVTSRENDIFDGLMELAFAAGLRDLGPTLGSGFRAANLVTLQIDGAAHREGLAALGYPVAAPARRICHWSPYLRPGLFPFYRAFLHSPDRLPLATLRTALPEATAPRWSRLIPPLPWGPSPAH
jgi:hypothetical protein